MLHGGQRGATECVQQVAVQLNSGFEGVAEGGPSPSLLLVCHAARPGGLSQLLTWQYCSPRWWLLMGQGAGPRGRRASKPTHPPTHGYAPTSTVMGTAGIEDTILLLVGAAVTMLMAASARSRRLPVVQCGVAELQEGEDEHRNERGRDEEVADPQAGKGSATLWALGHGQVSKGRAVEGLMHGWAGFHEDALLTGHLLRWAPAGRRPAWRSKPSSHSPPPSFSRSRKTGVRD